MRQSTRVIIAIVAGIAAIFLEVVIAVRLIGGWTEVTNLLAMLSMMSIIGLIIALGGILIGHASALVIALIVYLLLGFFVQRTIGDRVRGVSATRSDREILILLCVLLVVILGILGTIYSSQKSHADRERQREIEFAKVRAFVESNPKVLAANGGKLSASVSTSYYDDRQSNLPSKYDVLVQGDRLIYTVVHTHRNAGAVEFTLSCVSMKAPTERQPGEDECSP